MSQSALTITYHPTPGAGAIADPFWLRLEQEGVTDDVATARDAAALVDTVFELEPCETEAEPEEQTGAQTAADLEGPTLEDLEAAAREVLDLAVCDIAPDGSAQVQIRVIRARLDYPYTLRVTGGEVLSTSTIEAEHQYAATVADADQVQVDYPILGNLAVSWQGSTTGGEPPEIRQTGTTLHWDRGLSGVLQATYRTRYDLVTIKVYGDPDSPGEQGEATIRCFCHGLVEELEPELPEPAEDDRDLCPDATWEYEQEDEVTCFRTVVTHLRCRCSRDEFDRYEVDEEVACPDGAPVRCPNNETRCRHRLATINRDQFVECPGEEYVPGTGDTYPLSDRGYYLQTCCRELPIDEELPVCPVMTLNWGGGARTDKDQSYYQSLYGPATRLVGVSPQEECGEWTIEWEVRPNDCCDEIEPMQWNRAISATVIAPTSTAEVGVTGGRAPYAWRISGEGFFFAGRAKKTMVTDTARITVETVNACGRGVITVTDGCSSAVGVIRSTGGSWEVVPQGDWPDPPALAAYDDFVLHIGQSITMVAEEDGYKYQQDYESLWASAGWNNDQYKFVDACAKGPLLERDLPYLISLEQQKYTGIPEFISRSTVGKALADGWVPSSQFGLAEGKWEVCAEGIVCVDALHVYDYTYDPHYWCYWLAGGFFPTEQIVIWKWTC